MAVRETVILTMVGFLGACTAEPEQVVVPEREAYRTWIKVEPPGAVCGDGSQYKFFVNFSDAANDVVVAFEPGGACWDYPSCSGAEGIRGAANVNGLDDDHYALGEFIIPFFKRDWEEIETRDWNFVYVPYCTGDVHTGNNVVTYSDPEGQGEDLVFHHKGHDNVMGVIDWMKQHFTDVPRMLVTGCSAGGVGSLVNYYYLRNQLPGVERGYLLSDSGPIFPSSGWSGPLHEKIRASWDIDSILTDLPASFDDQNFGSINTVLADEFPGDRLGVTMFQRDYNFSLYSYERFYDEPAKDDIMRMWSEDIQSLTDLFDARDNLSYFLPYWRAVNDSHCSTVISFAGSEIEELDMGMEDYVRMLLDDGAELESFQESVQPGEDVD